MIGDEEGGQAGVNYKSNVIVDEEGAQAGVNYKSNVIGDEEGGQAGHGLKEETEETEKIYKTGWDIGIPK